MLVFIHHGYKLKKKEKKKKYIYKIAGFDESFKARIVLDIHVMELDTVSPRKRVMKEVIDFVGRYINNYGFVRSFGH